MTAERVPRSGPLTRYLPRGNQQVRQWRLLVALRRRAYTVNELAPVLGCTTRTVRRDLDVLQASGFPIYIDVAEEGRQPAWRVLATPEWPAGEVAPVADLPACATGGTRVLFEVSS